MNLHEHQAKALLAEYGVPIPRGKVAFSVDEAVAAAADLGLPVVVKAQIHAGGRGKAGGVRLARTEDEVRAAADAILGATLVTKQTGPEGRLVRRLLIEEGVAIARELYVSFIIDRSSGRPMCIASAAGGMDIEEVAAETPEKILTVTVDPAMGIQPFQARRLAFGLGFEGQVFRNGTKFLTALYRAFEGLDASQVEINPMLVTEGGDVLALDAKVSVDDSALFRQPKVAALRDIHEESPLEVEASKHRLSYIKLDGSVGCMVNGAGLAMATMDIVKLGGGVPRKLPRRRGRRQRGPDRERLPHPLLGPRGAVGADQHLRRHPPLRPARQGADRRGPEARGDAAHRDPHGGDERGTRPPDARGVGARLHHRGRDARRRRAGGPQAGGGPGMSVLVGNETRLVVQGITGREGAFHAEACRDYGTNLVAGVVPGKGGQTAVGVPVFDTVAEAVEKTEANVGFVLVPPPFCADAYAEAVDAGLDLVVSITEGVPTRDMVRVMRTVPPGGTRILGPNCPGVISPGKAKVGIMPGFIHKEGHVGVVSRSGTLTYEAVHQLSERGIGQSTCVGIGGDPVIGTNFVDVLELFAADDDTGAVILIGEIGGGAEEEAADFIRRELNKPVVAFIAGQTAPPGRRMGHAGAIVMGGQGTAAGKMEALRSAGCTVVESPAEMGAAMEARLQG